MNQDKLDPVSSIHLKQISFFVLLIALAYLLFSHLIIFLPAFLGAVTFYVLLRKWNLTLVNKHKMKKGMAAALLIVLVRCDSAGTLLYVWQHDSRAYCGCNG